MLWLRPMDGCRTVWYGRRGPVSRLQNVVVRPWVDRFHLACLRLMSPRTGAEAWDGDGAPEPCASETRLVDDRVRFQA